MKRNIFLAVILSLFCSIASAQVVQPSVRQSGTVTLDAPTYWQAKNLIKKGNQNYINLYDAGACTAGDNTAVINAAYAAAKTAGAAMLVPACAVGYNHAGVIVNDSVETYCLGESSNFISTNTTGSNPNNAVKLTGTGPAMFFCKISSSWVGTRQSNNNSDAILVDNAVNYKVIGNHVSVSASGGIMVTNGSHGGEVGGNIVENTLADGNINTGASYGNNTHDNTYNSTGDDCTSVVSYVSDTDYTHHISERDNHCNNGLARGFTVVGGHDITIIGGDITNVVGACLYTASETSTPTRDVYNVTMTGVQENACGELTPSALAANYIGGRSGFITKNIHYNFINGINLRNNGVQVGSGGGAYADAIDVSHNTLRGNGLTTNHYGSYAFGGKNITFAYNNFYDWAEYGSLCAASSDDGKIDISHNYYENLNISNTAAVDAINCVDSGATHLVIADNSEKDGANALDVLVEIGTTDNDPVIYGNYGNVKHTVRSPGVQNFMRISRRFDEANAVPASGTWAVGDLVFNKNPSLGSPAGWINTVAGTPGTWQQISTVNNGVLQPANGGTGVANSSTITLGGALTMSGAFPATFTVTGTTAVTFPTSGTLATTANSLSSFTGDGALINNSASTGAVTVTLANAAANTVWGNNTSGSAAPGYQTTINTSGSHTASSFIATGTTIPANGVYLPAANSLGFATNSTLAITIDSSQRVGIGSTTPTQALDVTGQIRVSSTATLSGDVSFASGTRVQWNADTTLRRKAANSIIIGTTDGASPSAQILGVQNVVAGTTDGNGNSFSINGSQGTGAGNGGSIILQTAPASSTGTTQNALSAALTLDSKHGATFTGGVFSGGTKFTTSGCSISSTTGGAFAGKFTLGANNCTAVITMNGATGSTAPNGWACSVADLTASTILVEQSASSTTTASFSVPVTAGATDVISFSCTGY